MNPVVNLNITAGGIEVDFSPSGIVKKTKYAKDQIAACDYDQFAPTDAPTYERVMITGASDTLRPTPTMYGISLAESIAEGYIVDGSMFLVNEINGIPCTNTTEIYTAISNLIG